MFVYEIESIFTVKLFVLRQINSFYLHTIFAWCILKLYLYKLIIVCLHNNL
jgi:hypothetical protein